MNYRHAFHAGNFADLLKHGILTQLLRAMTVSSRSLTVIDTHAGAGLYDLSGEAARRTGEADVGIVRMIASCDTPTAFDDLRMAVLRANKPGDVRFYPGSPMLIASALRPHDRYVACEVRPDDYSTLKSTLVRQTGAEVLQADGWRVGSERVPAAPYPLLVLIDPPFERPDDAAQAVRLAARIRKRNADAVLAVWVPIKDLTTFDALVMDMHDATAGATLMVVEVRLRPLTDPMRMNGCAMILINPPPGLDVGATAVADWIVRTLGEPGGMGRIERL